MMICLEHIGKISFTRYLGELKGPLACSICYCEINEHRRVLLVFDYRYFFQVLKLEFFLCTSAAY